MSQMCFIYIDVFPGSIGGQLLNGAEGGSDGTSLNNVGNSNCDNNTTTNNHANNRNITGQNTPDGKYIDIVIHLIKLSAIVCLLLLIIKTYNLCKFSGCGLSDNPGSTSSSGGATIGQANANHNLNPLSNGPSGSVDDGSGGGNTLGSCMNNTGAPNMNNTGNNGSNHLNSSLEDVKPSSHLGSSSNSSTPQHQV